MSAVSTARPHGKDTDGTFPGTTFVTVWEHGSVASWEPGTQTAHMHACGLNTRTPLNEPHAVMHTCNKSTRRLGWQSWEDRGAQSLSPCLEDTVTGFLRVWQTLPSRPCLSPPSLASPRALGNILKLPPQSTPLFGHSLMPD